MYKATAIVKTSDWYVALTRIRSLALPFKMKVAGAAVQVEPLHMEFEYF